MEELQLLSKAYMKVSCNAKHGTDEKDDNFLDNIALHYDELVHKSNSMHEDNIDYFAIDSKCRISLQLLAVLTSVNSLKVLWKIFEKSIALW